MNKKKIADFINSKGGKGVVFGSIGFLVFGLTCFIVGYGLVDGWDAVLAWFTSRWAIYVYIFVFVWVLVVLTISHFARRYDDGK